MPQRARGCTAALTPLPRLSLALKSAAPEVSLTAGVRFLFIKKKKLCLFVVLGGRGAGARRLGCGPGAGSRCAGPGWCECVLAAWFGGASSPSPQVLAGGGSRKLFGYKGGSGTTLQTSLKVDTGGLWFLRARSWGQACLGLRSIGAPRVSILSFAKENIAKMWELED